MSIPLCVNDYIGASMCAQFSHTRATAALQHTDLDGDRDLAPPTLPRFFLFIAGMVAGLRT